MQDMGGEPLNSSIDDRLAASTRSIPPEGYRNATGRERRQRLAFSIPRLCRLTDLGRTLIYAEIAAGRLVASKVGRRTVVTRANAVRWLRSLETTSGLQLTLTKKRTVA